MLPVDARYSTRVIEVTDPADARVADYHDVREADLVGRRGIFIAEGEMVLRTLAERGRFRIRSVLLARSRVDKLGPWLDRLEPTVPIYVADGAVMSTIAGFDIHRGVLAVGDRAEQPEPRQLLDGLGPGPRLCVALAGLTNHDNVGGIFRSAAAFGVDAVLLDDRCCDPLYRKAIRVSIGAALFLPFARAPSSAQLIHLLRDAGFTVLALSPRRDSVDIVSLRAPGQLPERVAWLLGTEGPGLSEPDLAAADAVVRIAIHDEVDAINVATATGIALHEFRSVYPLARR